jgi:hypothetical protein
LYSVGGGEREEEEEEEGCCVFGEGEREMRG